MMPTRDAVEFTAAVVVGAVLGAGLTRIALARGKKRSASRPRGGLARTVLQAMGDEAGTVLREAATGLGLGGSTNDGPG